MTIKYNFIHFKIYYTLSVQTTPFGDGDYTKLGWSVGISGNYMTIVDSVAKIIQSSYKTYENSY